VKLNFVFFKKLYKVHKFFFNYHLIQIKNNFFFFNKIFYDYYFHFKIGKVSILIEEIKVSIVLVSRFYEFKYL
jgi:hypothetical protein